MKFDYPNIEAERLHHFKGGEGDTIAKLFNDDYNKLLFGRLEPGSSIGYHKHETNSEVIFIVEGKGKCLIDDGEETLEAGQAHYCPKGHSHSLINNSDADLVFFAVIPEHER